MKRLHQLLFTFSLTLLTSAAMAQIIGGQRNGQSLPSEVKPSEISAGGFSGNVNLFAGTYNASYPLGTVSTPTGLSFSANLSYSSTFTTGDNLPHLSGVPYGEGWSLEIPSISISTEDFNKYTLWEKYHMGQGHDVPNGSNNYTPTFTLEEAIHEGETYWYAPTLNIPGVGGGRMVYKYYKQNKHYFVLHVFERYIEATFDGGTWEVTLDDGTVYQMIPAVISYRTPSNQRLSKDNFAETDDACDNVEGGKALSYVTLPKEEVLTWYCQKITNKNLVGAIHFKYETFGGFDYNKVFTEQNEIWELISKEWLAPYNFTKPDYSKTYKDIVLKEIDSGYERLILDYESISTATGDNLLDINDAHVTRLDSMYSSTVVYEASDDEGFDDWFRYKHVRRDGGGVDPDWDPSPRNPYRTFAGKYLREPIINSSPAFHHGYLESPRLTGAGKYVPGDVYEIKTKIAGGCQPGSDPSTGAFFDVNIATGNHTNISIGNQETQLIGTVYEKLINEPVFTTFNQAIKWHTHGNGNLGMPLRTSNYFVMPSLPDAYEGFQIQVGPANSDNDFSTTPQNILLNPPFNNVPGICHSYFDDEYCDTHPGASCNAYLKSGDEIPHNFGIGLPWRMLTEFYSQWSAPFCFCPVNGNPGKWWNNQSPTIPYDNIPTMVEYDPDHHKETSLDEVQLIRYAKNPYMLKKATKQINNESSYDPNNYNSVWHTTGIQEFEYEIDIAPRYGTSMDAAYQVTMELKDYRNIVLLTKATQLPYQPGVGTTETLITKFGYKKVNNELPNGIYITPLTNSNYTVNGVQNVSTAFTSLMSKYLLLENIEDPLGKLTTINYREVGEGSYFIKNYEYRQRPGEIQGLPGGNTVKQTPTHAYQVFMVVDKIVTSEREDLSDKKSWKYTFGPTISNWGIASPSGIYDDRPYFDEHFAYDRQFNYKFGFPTATVYGPCQGVDVSQPAPSTLYRHHTDGKRWGKLYQIESKDIAGNLMSKTDIQYEAIPAFESPAHRVFMDDLEQWDYKEYWEHSRPRFTGDFDQYNNEMWGTIDENTLAPLEIYLGYLTQNPPPTPPTHDCSDWDHLSGSQQGECLAYWDDLTVWFSNRPQGWITPYRQPNSPNSYYEFAYARQIEGRDPEYLYSFFLKKKSETTQSFDKTCDGVGSSFVSTSTDYEYFDAQFDGTFTSTGWSVINAGNDRLKKEPSWQLYKKTTTSQDYTNAEESFYFWDLPNEEHAPYVDDNYYPSQGPYNLLWLLYTYRKQRTMLYEKRVTNTAPGGTNTRSTSYVYSAEWNPEEGDGDVVNIIDPNNQAPCGSGQPGSGNSGNQGGGTPPCFQYKGFDHPCPPSNCGAFCEVQHDPPFHLYCTPCGIMPPPTNNFSGSGSGTNYHNYEPGEEVQEYMNNRLQGKIYLKKIVEQVGPSCHGLFTNNTPGFEQPGFNCDSLTTYEVLSRNPLGMVVEEMDEKYLHTRYTYGQGYNLVYLDCGYTPPALRSIYLADFPGLPTKAEVGYGRNDALTSLFDYNVEDNTVKTITDPNDMKLEYLYDGFGRMGEARRNGELIQKVAYSNSNQTGGSFTGSTEKNYVDAFNYVQGQSGWGTIGFIDPLGRKVGTVNYSGGTKVLVEDNIFDVYDRSFQKLKRQISPTPIVNLAMDPTHLNFELDVAPKNRAVETAKYGRALGDGHTVEMDYCFKAGNLVISEIAAAGQNSGSSYISSGNTYLRTETVDEDGKTVVTFTDGGGNTAATISNNGTVATLFKYGPFGKAVSVLNANNQAMSYNYNFVGQLISKASPDEGANSYAYNQSGQLICQRDNKGDVRVYDYDIFGRMKVQAKENSNNDHGMLNHTLYDGMPWRPQNRRDYAFLHDAVSNSKKEKEWYYHLYSTSNYLIDAQILTDYLYNGEPQYKNGRLAQTVSYDLVGNAVEYKFFAYNPEGFLKYEVSQFESGGMESGGDRIAVAIKYPEYNLQGSYKVQNVDILHKGSSVDYQHFYIYDSWNRIRKVYANFADLKQNGYLVAEYEYDDVLGVVNKKKMFNNDKEKGCKNIQVDEVKFEFDVRERLTRMRSTLYDHTLTYDDVVINNSDANYNGNINSTTASYKFPSPKVVNVPDNFTAPTVYGYKYDNLNRLYQASAVTSIFDPLHPIKYSGDPSVLGNVNYTYDKVGNILTQDYGNGFKVAFDSIYFGEAHYVYNYQAGNNKLDFITGWGAISLECHDPNMAHSFQFGYDPNGNMTSNSKSGLAGVSYGRSNLAFGIGMGNYSCQSQQPGIRSYDNLYDASDARIWKSGEYYQRDGAGHELFVYQFISDEFTWYVYGNERVAKIGKKTAPDDGDGGPGACRVKPACDGASELAQTQFLAGINYVTNPANISYPTKLFRIRFCSGIERYLLHSEMANIPGNYAIVQQIDLLDVNQNFTVWSITGLSEISINQMLLDRIGNDQMFLNGFTPCKPFDCPAEQIDCGSSQGTSQAASIASLKTQYAGITPASVSLPTRLVRIRLCSGAEIYILLEMLPSIQGNFTVLQQIEVHSADQSFEFSENGGATSVAFFDYVLARLFKEDVLLNNYEPCMNSLPCDPAPPTCSSSMEEDQEAAIVDLQQAFVTATTGSFTYPTHLFRVRLCSGQEFYVFQEETHLIPGNYLILQDITVNDPQGGASQQFPMTVMINATPLNIFGSLSQLLDYRRGVKGFLKIVGDYEPCGDISECSPSAPGCTPQEQAEQNQSLNSLLANFPGYTPETLSLPTRLFLVRLCDGREIYLLEDELRLLSGNISYLQEIPLSSWSQTFTIVMNGSGNPVSVSLEQLLKKRVQMNFTVDGYGCSLVSSTKELSCIYTIDQIDWKVESLPGVAHVTWTKVVYRNCGEGPELILSVPESYEVPKLGYREYIGASYIACDTIYSLYRAILKWTTEDLPYFAPASGIHPQSPYEVDNQAPLTCTETITIRQMVCPPLCGPSFDEPDPDGDGCPDGTTITHDHSQLATTFHQAANAGSTSVPVPNYFNNVRFSDGSRRVVLDNELGQIADCVEFISKVPVGSDAGQYFHVELSNGGGSATLQNVLDLRAAGLVLEVTAPTATDLPPHTTPNTDAQFPTVPEFTFFVYDHLGNTRVMYHNDMYECQAFRTHYVLEHVLDYYPYGKTLREYLLDRERFETTYHERDIESGLDYRGARFYDGDVGRFLSVDPKSVDFAGWSTYVYTLDNSINFVDPDGKSPIWIPTLTKNGSIKLIVETGDNYNTFIRYFDGSSQFSSEELKKAWDNSKGHAVISLPEDNYSDAFKYASENSDDFAKDDYSDYANKADNYNCYHFSLNGATKGEIYGWRIPFFNSMNYSNFTMYDNEAKTILDKDFRPSDVRNLAYGKTILAFRATLNGRVNLYQHYAVYAGTDKNGNIYVFTKPGLKAAPKIQLLSELMDELPAGSNNWTIDYYEPK